MTGNNTEHIIINFVKAIFAPYSTKCETNSVESPTVHIEKKVIKLKGRYSHFREQRSSLLNESSMQTGANGACN